MRVPRRTVRASVQQLLDGQDLALVQADRVLMKNNIFNLSLRNSMYSPKLLYRGHDVLIGRRILYLHRTQTVYPCNCHLKIGEVLYGRCAINRGRGVSFGRTLGYRPGEYRDLFSFLLLLPKSAC